MKIDLRYERVEDYSFDLPNIAGCNADDSKLRSAGRAIGVWLRRYVPSDMARIAVAFFLFPEKSLTTEQASDIINKIRFEE